MNIKKIAILWAVIMAVVGSSIQGYQKRCYLRAEKPEARLKSMQKADYVLFNEKGAGKDCYVWLTERERALLLETLSKSPRTKVTEKIARQFLDIAEFEFIGQILQDFLNKRKRARNSCHMTTLTYGEHYH